MSQEGDDSDTDSRQRVRQMMERYNDLAAQGRLLAASPVGASAVTGGTLVLQNSRDTSKESLRKAIHNVSRVANDAPGLSETLYSLTVGNQISTKEGQRIAEVCKSNKSIGTCVSIAMMAGKNNNVVDFISKKGNEQLLHNFLTEIFQTNLDAIAVEVAAANISIRFDVKPPCKEVHAASS